MRESEKTGEGWFELRANEARSAGDRVEPSLADAERGRNVVANVLLSCRGRVGLSKEVDQGRKP